jgi:hypothetical protein
VKNNALAPTVAPSADLHREFISVTIHHLRVCVAGAFSKADANRDRPEIAENRRLLRPRLAGVG